MKLDDSAVDAALAGIGGWSRTGNVISRSFQFSDFRTAFAFMTACALAAEKMNRHPDWSNSWSRVDVSLTTHDSGGITARDLELALVMNQIASGFGG